ncbi:hypothetical protein ACFV4I_14790 [Nocardiopsis alba]|uniref:hypothetical protein n=1 Tax=Nocardiopsis alba TaxID=53437 RepID=UPI0036588B2C
MPESTMAPDEWSAVRSGDHHQIHFAWAEPTLLGHNGPGPAATSLTADDRPALRSWRDRLLPALTADYRSALADTAPSAYPETLWARHYPDGRSALVYRWPGDVRRAHAWAIVGPSRGLTLPRVLALHENPNTRPADSRPPSPGWATMRALRAPEPWELTAAPGAVRSRDRRAAETRIGDEPILIGAVARALAHPDRPVHLMLEPERADLWQAVQLRFLWGMHRILHDVLTPPSAIPAAAWNWSFSTYEPVLGGEDGPHLAFGPPVENAAGRGPFLSPAPLEHLKIADALVTILREEGGDALTEHLNARGVPGAGTFADRLELIQDWLDPRPGPGEPPNAVPDERPRPEEEDTETAVAEPPVPETSLSEGHDEERDAPARPSFEALEGEESASTESAPSGPAVSERDETLPEAPGGELQEAPDPFAETEEEPREREFPIEKRSSRSRGVPAGEEGPAVSGPRRTRDRGTLGRENDENAGEESEDPSLDLEATSLPGFDEPELEPSPPASRGEGADSATTIRGTVSGTSLASPTPTNTDRATEPATLEPASALSEPVGTVDPSSSESAADETDSTTPPRGAAPVHRGPEAEFTARTSRTEAPSPEPSMDTVPSSASEPGTSLLGTESEPTTHGRTTPSSELSTGATSPGTPDLRPSSRDRENVPAEASAGTTFPSDPDPEPSALDPDPETPADGPKPTLSGASDDTMPPRTSGPEPSVLGSGSEHSGEGGEAALSGVFTDTTPPSGSEPGLDPESGFSSHGRESHLFEFVADPEASSPLSDASAERGTPPALSAPASSRDPDEAPALPFIRDEEAPPNYEAETAPEVDEDHTDPDDNWPTHYIDLPLARLERWHRRRGPEGARTDVADVHAAVRAERSELDRVRSERDHYHVEVQELRRENARLDRSWIETDADEEPARPRRRGALRILFLLLLLTAALAIGVEVGARVEGGVLGLLGMIPGLPL